MQLLSPVASNTTSKPSPLEPSARSFGGQIACIRDSKSEMARCEIEAVAIAVGNHHIQPGDAGKERGTQPDRACAYDQGSLACTDKRPPDRRGADGEEFDRGRLGECQPVRGIKVGGGNDDPFAQSSVAMHAEHFDRFAGRRPFRLAAKAFSAGEIGIDDDLLADGKRYALSDHEHLAGQLVTGHARICQTRYATFEQAKVGSAHTDMTDTHQHPAFARRTRCGIVCEPQFARRDTAYGLHIESHFETAFGMPARRWTTPRD